MYSLNFFIHVKEIFDVGVQPKDIICFQLTMYNMECYIDLLSMAGHCEGVWCAGLDKTTVFFA